MPPVCEGITVVDFGSGFAPSVASMILADNGADVIEIEPPGGDPLRSMPAWRMWNRGKKSVALNLESGEGRDAARRLEDAGWEVTETACPPLREPAQLQLNLWLADVRRAGRQIITNEDDPDANFVFSQLEALAPEPDLNAVMDILQARATFTRQWQMFLKDYPVLICPASAEKPFPDLLDVESPDTFRRIVEAQLLMIGIPFMGLPGLIVSTGMAGSAPVGVQRVAGRYREDVLLEAGETVERGGAPISPVDPAI